MPAYLIAHSTITDSEKFQKYVSASEDSLSLYGGKYLLGGSVTQVLEGNHDKSRTIIFQFPSAEHAKDWYGSGEYQSVKPLRDNTGVFDFVVLDSF